MSAVISPGQSPSPPSAASESPCSQQGAALEGAATWLAAYANQTRTLLGPPLREPNDTQQKAYDAFNEHAEQFKKIAPAIADPSFAAALAGLKSAYEKGVHVDQFVVEYAESLGAFRSETQTGEDDPLEALPPNANNHAKALQEETLKRAGVLREALGELWMVLGAAKSTLADVKRGCRP